MVTDAFSSEGEEWREGGKKGGRERGRSLVLNYSTATLIKAETIPKFCR
jgi:hypothetical protein